MKNYIQELLYTHNSVIIPAFGGFTTGYRPASIDHVQGVIFPPSKDLKFNRYLTLNDGVLIQHLCDEKGWTRVEAEQAVKDWVKEMKDALERREMLEFPKVGRLYLDFEGNFQFLQDNTNYNRESFGLPTVGFYPVARNRKKITVEKKEIPRPRPVSEATIVNLGGNPSQSQVVSAWFQRNVPYFVAASVMILSLTIWVSSNEVTPNTSNLAALTKTVSEDRVNTKPQRVEDSEITSLYAEDMIDRTAEKSKKKEEMSILPSFKEKSTPLAEDSNLDTEGATVAPGLQEAVVIIGSFGNKGNVDRLVKKIYSKGYEPFTVKDGKLTKVGVRFAYDTTAEVKTKRSRVADDFDVKAWIMTPEGIK